MENFKLIFQLADVSTHFFIQSVHVNGIMIAIYLS